MATATSIFLQGANAANAAMSAPSLAAPAPVDATQVLAAIAKPQVSDLASLALALDLTQGSVRPVLETLCSEGLVAAVGDDLKLSDSGQRALRYTALSKIS